MNAMTEHRPAGPMREAAEGMQNWRDGALNAALRAESMSGESEDALLAAIRRHRPHRATALIWVDRTQLLRFAEMHGHDFGSLVTPDFYRASDSDGALRPYVGWYAVEWEGAQIEIALPPDWGEPGYAILVAGDPRSLCAFEESALYYANRPSGRCLRYSQGWASAPDMDREIGKVTWDDIVLSAETKAGIREAVEGFFKHRSAFSDLGFPWRRGILLVGPPGTGKTMICKAAAAAIPELPFLYVRNLKERSCRDDAIRSIFERARTLSPCILAFEDMDGFVKDGNRTEFLNELDGFKNNDGLLILGSSNHPGKIDEALLKRPSRFDRVFHIGLPGPIERLGYGRLLLARFDASGRLAETLDREGLAAAVAEKSDGFTPAYLKEAYLSAALELAQTGHARLGPEYADAVLRQVEALRSHLRKTKDPDALGEMRSRENPIGLRR